MAVNHEARTFVERERTFGDAAADTICLLTRIIVKVND